MAARPRMAAARSPARTRPRSTARLPMRRATSPRTWWRPSSPTAARSSSPMPSASRSRCRSMSTCTAPARSRKPSSRRRLRKVMDLSPTGIRKHLDLNKPIYAKTSSYGHFGRKPGRDGSFSWEKTDLVKGLKDAVADSDGHCRDRGPQEPLDRSFLRPTARQDHSPAAGHGACRRAEALSPRSRQAGAGRISQRFSPSRLRPSSWRSASAAASICFTRQPAVRIPASSASSRSSIRMAKMMAALAEKPLANLRVYDDDATQLLDWLPDASLAGIDLLYPDPWPKKKHWKRRFVSPVNLDRFARVLKKGRSFPLRFRHRQLRQLDAARLRRAWRLCLAGGGSRRLATALSRAGRERATRQRRCARTGGRPI